MPNKGMETKALIEMMKVLAEPGLEEMYGARNQAEQNDQEDFWPFVAIPLTTPLHIHQ